MPDQKCDVIEIAIRDPSRGAEVYVPLKLNIDWASGEFSRSASLSGLESEAVALNAMSHRIETILEERAILRMLLASITIIPDGEKADITPALEEYEKT